ncbi:mrna cap guanine-n7 methyltransferase 1, partial [Nicotiana attenuata]
INNVLIQLYAKRGDAVLNLACGKGDDLIKWDKAKIGYDIGIDICFRWMNIIFLWLFCTCRFKSELSFSKLFIFY